MNVSQYKKYDKSEKLNNGDVRYILEDHILLEIKKKPPRNGIGSVISKRKVMDIKNRDILKKLQTQLA